jgi:uncharacterized membrane protein YkgB
VRLIEDEEYGGMDFFPSLGELSHLLILRNLGILSLVVAWLYFIGLRRRELCLVGCGAAVAINLVGCPLG